MITNEVPITYKEMPVLGTSEAIINSAASLLLEERTPIVLPGLVETPEGPVRAFETKIGLLVLGLNQGGSQVWESRPGQTPLIGRRSTDMGFHGNAWDAEDPLPLDFIRLHTTVDGSVEVTSATAREPAYANSWGKVDGYLTALLRRDLTDPLYVDPNSFRRAHLGDGALVAFPLYLGGPERHTCLHEFLTTSPVDRLSILADVISTPTGVVTY